MSGQYKCNWCHDTGLSDAETTYIPCKRCELGIAQACKEWVEKYGEFVRSPASESLQAILENFGRRLAWDS